eukprot:m.170552 g.170552  ORF g.170552 m.170552 type:complete len:1025 (-) comp31613_c0_seq1:58-3132(-)
MFKNLKSRLKTNASLETSSSPAPLSPNPSEIGTPSPLKPREVRDLASPTESALSPARHSDDLSAEDMARLAEMPREDLVLQLQKQTKDVRRCKRKLKDLVAAYKPLSEKKEKLEAALVLQQDTSKRRAKELVEMHKKDIAIKDKLVEALKKRVGDKEETLVELQEKLNAFAIEKKELLDKVENSNEVSKKGHTLFQMLEDLKEKIITKNTEIEQLNKSVAQSTTKQKTLNQTNEELNLSLKHNRVELTKQVEINATLRESLKTRLPEDDGENKTKITKLEILLKEKDVSLQRSMEQVSDLEDQLDKLHTSVDEQLQEASTISLKATERETAMQKELDLSLDKCTKLLNQTETYAADLTSTQREVASLQRKLDEQSAAHTDNISLLESEVSSLNERDLMRITSQEKTSEINHDNSQLTLLESENRGLREKLKSRTDEMNKTMRSLREEKQGVMDENNDLHGTVATTTRTVETLETKLSRTTKRLEETNNELKAVRTKMIKTNEDLRKITVAESASQSDLKAALQRNTALKQLLATHERTVIEKDQLFAMLKRSKEELEHRWLEKSEETLESGAEVSALRIKLEAESLSHESVVEDLEAQANQDKKTIVDLKKKLNLVEKERSTLKNDFKNVTENLDDVSKKENIAEVLIGEMRAQLEEAKAKLETLTNNLTEAKAATVAEAVKVEGLENELAGSGARALKHADALSRMEQAHATLNEQHASVLETLTNVSERLRQAEASSASYQYTAESQAQMVAVLTEEKTKQQSVLETLRLVLGQKNAEIESLSNANAVSDRTVEALQTEIHSLQEAVDQATITSTSLKNQLDTAKKTAEASRNLISEHETLVTSLEHKLEQAKAEILTLEEGNASLSDDYNLLSKDLQINRMDSTSIKEKLLTMEKSNMQLSTKLSATIAEHQISSKLQQQHTNDLKKTLQKTIKSSNSMSGYSDIEVGGLSMSPTSFSGANGEEVNFEYLKNIVLRYMTSRTTEAKHLLKVIAMMLKFTKEEERRVERHTDESAGSWLNWG